MNLNSKAMELLQCKGVGLLEPMGKFQKLRIDMWDVYVHVGPQIFYISVKFT